MKLIVDSGATKADWCLVSEGRQVARVQTPGISLTFMSPEDVGKVAAEALKGLGEDFAPDITEVHFFAAGLVQRPERALEDVFPAACIEYESDLVAAARAVCGRRPGIAAIIGTGSNSCLWDGWKVTANIRPGGFILGDEGSGAVLGKLFLADYLRGLVSGKVAEAFASRFDASYLSIVKGVYRSEAPSRYLGSIVPFILENQGDEYIDSLIYSNFRSFFERCLSRYEAPAGTPVGIVGGLAAACSGLIGKAASECGMKVSKILSSPMEGLTEYYGI